MTWAEFITAVDSHLAVEANRRGMATFRARYMRNAVLDLQRYIRGYRDANTTTYALADVSTEGEAQLVTLPVGSKPKAFYIYSTDEDLDPLCARYRLGYYPWNKRQDMICGRLNFADWWNACCTTAGCPPVALTDDEQQAWTSKAYVYTIGPMGRNFLIYPKLTASTRLLVVWDGYKYDFANGDYMNLPEEASEAVAAYVMWKVTRNVDKNIALSREFEQDWKKLRLSLYTDFREIRDLDEEDQEYGADTIVPVPQITAFGAQYIPFLTSITGLEGATTAFLSHVPTENLSVPFMVQIKIGGVTQTWVLQDGTAATGPGVQRPNDYDTTDNARIWVQLS